jgi:MFS family permease
MLARIYPDAYKASSAQANVASITFAGTVLGMLFFGYTSDHYSRKWSLFVSTIIIILFAALGTGSYGAGGSPTGLLAALVAYRFFLGIGKMHCVQHRTLQRLTKHQASVANTQLDR